MESVKLPAGYRLPKGTTMADVRRFDQELLESEDLEAREHKAKEGHEKAFRGEVAPEARALVGAQGDATEDGSCS